MVSSPQWITKDKVADVLITILIMISIGLAGFALKQINEIGNRVSALEKGALSSKDGLDIWKEMSGIKEKVAAIPNSTPPEWFIKRVDLLQGQIEKMDQKLDRHMQVETGAE